MTLRLGLFYPNARSIHVLSPEVIRRTPDLLDYEVHTDLAQTAEKNGFDYAFMADGWGSFGPAAHAGGYYDPIILSPLLAMHLLAVTTRLRCITTIHTSFFHPLLVARIGGALDALSKGRWGINIVTGSGFGEGLDKHTFGSLNSKQRYERASETMELLLRAWSGKKIEFDGNYFQVDGQLVGPNAALDPKPLVVSAGASDAGRAVPEECVTWCRAQDYQVVMGDDMACVDLDWWNRRLQRHAIPAQIVGRDADGAPTDHGIGYLRRADLTGDLDTDTVTVPGSSELGVLYRAAAWLSGHPHRDRRRTFTNVSTPARPGHEFDAITTALAACRHNPWQAIPDAAPRRRWSGWPHTPGVGPTLLSLYCWATHHTDSAAPGAMRPQLLDQQAVNSLIHLGWVQDPVVAGFTWARYTRYCGLLHTWATQADVGAELIEMWLTNRWRQRTAHHSPTAYGTDQDTH